MCWPPVSVCVQTMLYLSLITSLWWPSPPPQLCTLLLNASRGGFEPVGPSCTYRTRTHTSLRCKDAPPSVRFRRLKCVLCVCRFQMIEELSCEDVKKCYRGSTVSKYNSQFHKLFQCVPKDELLMKVYSCALLRDILLQGRLYISRNWLCFYANLFGKDIKVAIPVVSVRLVKKHKTAGLVPNGLAITTDTGQKYVFVSLLSRDSVYDILRRICTHLQVNGKSLSLKQFMEEPTLSLDEFPASDELVDEFPSVLKWRSKPAVVSMSASLPDLLGNSSSNLSSADKPVKPEQLLEALFSSSCRHATWPSGCAVWSSSCPSSIPICL
ncbi:GRAM domain-containing protein 2A isoform X5 [Takifugu flavidus]|uniref:GRAM domain-containing protein 2A isoform X5 n=1 Tax=Takifugu flavidus TaxID=433684 RepID=UPI0025446360|nr:GRAM domain-containing protein 2A isoform X5 [Takifugu flavidus]